MTQQPEALTQARLAELLDTDGWPDAAAELRRLHSVNAALIKEVAALSANSLDDYRQIERLASVNQQLLEALELIAGTDPVDAALDPQRAVRVARAAIAAAKNNG